MRTVAALIALTLLAGCVQRGPEQPSIQNALGSAGESTVDVIHDDKRGVTCWVSDGFYSGGISCLPDSQIKQATP